MNLFSVVLKENDLDSSSTIRPSPPQVDASSRSSGVIIRREDESSTMISQSLITDHALTLAKTILDIVSLSLPEEKRKEAFGMFFEVAKGVLLSYEEKASRMQRRVKPSNS
jgi:hypothetical protein